ncbi:MAG TPA: hypothetical protein V6C90_19285 [Coleofasciculaceae cyanobacterium]
MVNLAINAGMEADYIKYPPTAEEVRLAENNCDRILLTVYAMLGDRLRHSQASGNRPDIKPIHHLLGLVVFQVQGVYKL